MIPIEGSVDLPRPPEEVFQKLLDPAVLRRCIPACEDVQDLGGGRYRAALKVGVGPIKGTFKADITVSELDASRGLTLTITGRSLLGRAEGRARITLAPAAGGTRLSCAGEVRLTGVLASFGQRLSDPAAKKLTEDFLARLAAALLSPR